MLLSNVENLMKRKLKNADFDSYAVYVKLGDDERTITSKNVNEDTYFDVASCGKVLVTSPLILQSIGKGLLSLESTIGEFFDYAPQDKRKITVQQLLTHTSGIVRHNYSESLIGKSHDEFAEEILFQPLAYESGTDYVYSCSGMVLLGFILEKLYGDSLENIFEKYLKKPLGYTRSKFNIALDEPNAAICYRSKDVDGLLHPWDDENVRILRTSAGSGGQFFTLSDIKKYVNAVFEKDERLYPKELFDLAEKKYSPLCASESRALGWLYVDEKYPQTGKLFPTGSFGHCGHTGQSIFFNRQKRMCVILLTNATRFLSKRSNFCGYDYGKIMLMREEIHNAIYSDLTEQNLL